MKVLWCSHNTHALGSSASCMNDITEPLHHYNVTAVYTPVCWLLIDWPCYFLASYPHFTASFVPFLRVVVGVGVASIVCVYFGTIMEWCCASTAPPVLRPEPAVVSVALVTVSVEGQEGSGPA